ncbi:hypothetical protein L207DRAFT_121335 [Hyaloscypha variabilis F]|uniref:Uncharacterized protein n=1 Tax=Hyaloscypha variabilis (strain UAMH 11265 / GT02V1 / F) TaxID=1149755 RepID=A0A2J6RB47_HYAVF|nr:hypothetical protein L207DRAFT_121335 [Hyaloscypha variabilis F]
MSSNVPTAIDAALGGASFLSSLSTWMAFLALHAEPPSEIHLEHPPTNLTHSSQPPIQHILRIGPYPLHHFHIHVLLHTNDHNTSDGIQCVKHGSPIDGLVFGVVSRTPHTCGIPACLSANFGDKLRACGLGLDALFFKKTPVGSGSSVGDREKGGRGCLMRRLLSELGRIS